MVEILVNAMNRGLMVLDWTPQPDKYKNDNVHPCVRNIPNFAGHDWWMVTTPYPSGDSSVENPILYYGDSGNNGVPPSSWQGGVVVEDTPDRGYNSDGNLYFDGTKLWVFWRENYTPDCTAHGVDRGVFARYTTDGLTFSEKYYFCGNDFTITGKVGDTVMCPCVVNIDNSLKMLATYYEFTPSRKSYGLSVWDSADINSHLFTHIRNVGILRNDNFDFWHFDIFVHDNKYYCVATAEDPRAIYLGVSEDGINYTFWGTPLISTTLYGDYYYYKPTALVKDGILYLWHPVKANGISTIWMDSRNFNEVLEILNNGTSKITGANNI